MMLILSYLIGLSIHLLGVVCWDEFHEKSNADWVKISQEP